MGGRERSEAVLGMVTDAWPCRDFGNGDDDGLGLWVERGTCSSGGVANEANMYNLLF